MSQVLLIPQPHVWPSRSPTSQDAVEGWEGQLSLRELVDLNAGDPGPDSKPQLMTCVL